METIGYLEIKVNGSKGNLAVVPDNYDIRDIIAMLENAEQLLYPNDKTNRPIISYEMKEGSVRHIFKTSVQFIIGFNAVLGQIYLTNSIDFLDLPTAKAFESIQDMALKHEFSFTIKTSLEQSNKVEVNRTTQFHRSESVWADAELYFYGKLTNAGGKDRANIHILTEKFGTVRIQIPISFLEQYSENLLYKTFGVRASGKQHSQTGQLDTSSLKFIELVEYQSSYDDSYLNGLIKKASKSWSAISDKDSWLKEVRGTYEA